MEENKNVVNTSTTEKEGSKFGWGVLGFFFPLVGLILFLVWMKDKKRASKAAGIGALIGFIFSIISTVLLITFFGAILGIGLSEYDNYNDNYNKTPIVEEDTNNEEDDVCRVTEVKLTDSDSYNEAKKDLIIKYGYQVDISVDCKKINVVDENGQKLFTVLKDEKVKYKLQLGNEIIEVYEPSDLVYYKLLNSKNIVFVTNTMSPSSVKEYIYNYDTETALEIDKDFENEDSLPMALRGFIIGDNESIAFTTSIYTSSGFEGMRDDPKVKVLGDILSNKVTDIDATLAEYGIEDFPYERVLYYSKSRNGEYSSTPKVVVTKTIKDFYNENMKGD